MNKKKFYLRWYIKEVEKKIRVYYIIVVDGIVRCKNLLKFLNVFIENEVNVFLNWGENFMNVKRRYKLMKIDIFIVMVVLWRLKFIMLMKS